MINNIELNKWYYREGSIGGHKFKELYMFEEYNPDAYVNYKTSISHWEKHEGPEFGLETYIHPKIQVVSGIIEEREKPIPYEGNPLELIKEWCDISLSAIFWRPTLGIDTNESGGKRINLNLSELICII